MEGNIFQVIWFVIWGLLWAMYFVLDGFDLGVGMLLPFTAKDEKEKKLAYTAIGPFWDANEVWLITAGGATFAAFPRTYAVMFSALYLPLMLILIALIIRGVALEFRNKIESETWKKVWDWLFFIGSFVPPFLLGVAFGNIFKGIPIDAEGIFRGSILSLFNIYGILTGILFILFFLVHGAIWLAIRLPDKNLKEKYASIASRLWWGELIVAVIFLIATYFFTDLWNNYFKYPWLWIVPILTVVSLLLIPYFLKQGSYWKAWFASAGTIFFATFFGIGGLYPRMFPSSIDPSYSLTIYNSSSSLLTLKIMTLVVVIFVPIVLAYTFWVYKTFGTELAPTEEY